MKDQRQTQKIGMFYKYQLIYIINGVQSSFETYTNTFHIFLRCFSLSNAFETIVFDDYLGDLQFIDNGVFLFQNTSFILKKNETMKKELSFCNFIRY